MCLILGYPNKDQSNETPRTCKDHRSEDRERNPDNLTCNTRAALITVRAEWLFPVRKLSR